MNFHDVRFPTSLSFGSTGGPERRTEIVTLQNGFEERNSPWSQSRRRYDAGLGLRALDDLEVLIGFFEARHGQLFGFRWKDWTDFKSCKPSQTPEATDQQIGVGDGETLSFPLLKNYRSGASVYTRTITKPVLDTVRIAIGGDTQQAGTHFDVDFATGEVTFAAAPANGAPITAGYEFDVPVRFAADSIETSVSNFQAGEIPSVPLIEVRV
ncbi:MAG TPA: DUF2460 domain-containing protein [Paracoccaceae bacterium]|nr:DUF2460 domain-containing protein [Paracoccaceae bacterium]